MEECIEVVEAGLRVLARGGAVQPLRTAYWMPDRHVFLEVMPGMLEGLAADAHRGRHQGADRRTGQLPARRGVRHQGLVVLFEQERGRPIAILDASAVTAIRTAAASAVAAKPWRGRMREIWRSSAPGRRRAAISRPCEPSGRCGGCGSGSRRPESARRFADEEGKRSGLDVEPVVEARDAVEGADLIRTCHGREGLGAGRGLDRRGAPSSTWSAPARRNARASMRWPWRGRACSRTAASRRWRKRGISYSPETKGRSARSTFSGELGEVLEGKVPGRRSDEEITLFKSLGIAVEDLAAGRLRLRKGAGGGSNRPGNLAPLL